MPFRYTVSILLMSACSILSILPAAYGADLSQVLEAGKPSGDARLQKPIDLNAYHPWQPVTDPQAWLERAQEVRRRILVSCGLWPMPSRPPIQATIHGAIQRDGYTVEKVFFPSYPGFYVTGSLYRPTGKSGRLPAVLCPHGHWQNGRFYRAGDDEVQGQLSRGEEKTEASARFPLQARCAMLARLGCVVFHYDMVGYADSTQIRHSDGFLDAAAELRLQSFMGLQTFNSIRALDFLTSLPDVDPERIGVTGASGGGTQTFILCAIDARPAVAFPAVMVSTGMQGGCVCENASLLRIGSGNIEIAALCAPRPLGMTGANDWTIDIETKGLPELKVLYRAFGAEDLVMARCFPKFPHNYNQVSGELMYGWMNKHLRLGHPDPIAEKPFEPIEQKDLTVFDDAHPRPADAVKADSLRERLTADSDRQIRELRPRAAFSLERYRLVIGGALRAMTGTGLPRPLQVESRKTAVESIPGPVPATVEKFLISRVRGGEEVPVVALTPAKWNGSILIIIHPDGKKGALSDAGGGLGKAASAALAKGAAVIVPDVFRTGELSAPGGGGPGNPIPKGYVGLYYGYNRSILANRVHDILTTLSFAQGRGRDVSIRLAGLGRAGIWAALACGLAEGAVSRMLIEDDGFRFSQIEKLDDPMMLPGALKYGDVPGFLALCAPAEAAVINASGEVEPVARDAYMAAGASGRLRALRSGDASWDEGWSWLLKAD